MSEIKSTLNDETPTADLQIDEWISLNLIKPLSTEVNRASAANSCYKRRWFQRRGAEGIPFGPRMQLVFSHGDLVELQMLFFIKNALVGDGKLYSEVDFGEPTGESIDLKGMKIETYKQEDLSADMGGIKISAHADGWGKRNSDGEWELIEIKSASDGFSPTTKKPLGSGYAGFVAAGPGEYLKQAHALLMTDKAKKLGAKSVRFYFLRKQTSHHYSKLYLFDENLARDVIEEFKLSNQEEEPMKPFFPFDDEMIKNDPTKRASPSNPWIPSGKKIVAYPCSYCPYMEKCYPKTEIEFTKNDNGTYTPANVVKE